MVIPESTSRGAGPTACCRNALALGGSAAPQRKQRAPRVDGEPPGESCRASHPLAEDQPREAARS
jgi:hypothetical protein